MHNNCESFIGILASDIILSAVEAMIKRFLWLLVVALVKVSIQQCTIEWFEDKTALDTVESSEGSDAGHTFSINRTIYNCLSTNRTINEYRFMSVSILYIRSDSPDKLYEIRYDMECINGAWLRVGQGPTALTSSDTRTNCSDCTSTANDHHCTR